LGVLTACNFTGAIADAATILPTVATGDGGYQIHRINGPCAALDEQLRQAAPREPTRCPRSAARADTAGICSRDTPALGHR